MGEPGQCFQEQEYFQIHVAELGTDSFPFPWESGELASHRENRAGHDPIAASLLALSPRSSFRGACLAVGRPEKSMSHRRRTRRSQSSTASLLDSPAFCTDGPTKLEGTQRQWLALPGHPGSCWSSRRISSSC